MTHDVSNDYLKIGKIFSVHGIKGCVKVFPLTNDASRYTELSTVYLYNGTSMTELAIEDTAIKDKYVLVKFCKINTRTDAENLKDSFIYVDKANAVALEEDEYFIQDLIGLAAYDLDNFNIGTVSEVIQTGAVDVLVIKGESDYLIPALKRYVHPLVEKGMIKVDTSAGVECD